MIAVRAAQPTPTGRTGPAALLPRWEVGDVDGAVVVVDPGDVELACDVDRFPFAMEATPTPEGIRLLAVHTDGRRWSDDHAIR